MASSEHDTGCGLAIVTFFCGIAIGFVVALELIGPASITRDEAVAAGHAEYYLDDHHERQWRWKNDGCMPDAEASDGV